MHIMATRPQSWHGTPSDVDIPTMPQGNFDDQFSRNGLPSEGVDLVSKGKEPSVRKRTAPTLPPEILEQYGYISLMFGPLPDDMNQEFQLRYDIADFIIHAGSSTWRIQRLLHRWSWSAVTGMLPRRYPICMPIICRDALRSPSTTTSSPDLLTKPV